MVWLLCSKLPPRGIISLLSSLPPAIPGQLVRVHLAMLWLTQRTADRWLTWPGQGGQRRFFPQSGWTYRRPLYACICLQNGLHCKVGKVCSILNNHYLQRKILKIVSKASRGDDRNEQIARSAIWRGFQWIWEYFGKSSRRGGWMNRVTRIGQLGGSHKPATITDPLKLNPFLHNSYICLDSFWHNCHNKTPQEFWMLSRKWWAQERCLKHWGMMGGGAHCWRWMGGWGG